MTDSDAGPPPKRLRILEDEEIDNEGISYYASLVTYYSVFRLPQLAAPMIQFYLLALSSTAISA